VHLVVVSGRLSEVFLGLDVYPPSSADSPPKKKKMSTLGIFINRSCEYFRKIQTNYEFAFQGARPVKFCEFLDEFCF